MKLINEGNWNKPWPGMNVTCQATDCGAEMFIEEADVLPLDFNPGKCHVVCPICGNRVPFSDETLPMRMKISLNKERKYNSGDPF